MKPRAGKMAEGLVLLPVSMPGGPVTCNSSSKRSGTHFRLLWVSAHAREHTHAYTYVCLHTDTHTIRIIKYEISLSKMNCVMNLRCFWNACHTALQDFTEAALARNAQFEPFTTHKPSSRTVPPSPACGALAQIPDVTCYKLRWFFFYSTHT